MSDARNPVAIFSMGLGDHLIALPSLRALASLLGGRLSLICNVGVKETFFHDLALRNLYETRIVYLFGDTEPRYSDTGAQLRPLHIKFDAETVARQVGPCDLFLSLNHWHSPSVDELLDRLSPANSIGFFPSFKTKVPFCAGKHASDLMFDIPRCLDPMLKLEQFAGSLEFQPRVTQWAQQWRSTLPPSMKILAVHAESKPAKMWPVDRFVTVVDEFLARNPDLIVLALGLKDIGLRNGKYRERIATCYKLPLPCALALLGQCDFFLGVDSCMLHAADLFRVPGVGLFGPTDYKEYGFRFALHHHIRGEDQKMEAITETEVFDALQSLLAEIAIAESSDV